VSETAGQNERQASVVPEKATQGAEAQGWDWSWVEATVWSERMLAALGNGEKKGFPTSLIFKWSVVESSFPGQYREQSIRWTIHS
jgi:hypothetical protein